MNKTLSQAINICKKINNESLIDVLEFGVFDGKTTRQIRQSFDKLTPVYGFDTFTGLPEDWVGTPLEKGCFDQGGVIPKVEGVLFFKGLFNETIPEYLKIAKPIKLLHVDCDLYSSTIDVLYGLNQLIKKDTVIVFDEWYYNFNDIPENRQHEQKAFYEWANEFKVEHEEIPPLEIERRIIKINHKS